MIPPAAGKSFDQYPTCLSSSPSDSTTQKLVRFVMVADSSQGFDETGGFKGENEIDVLARFGDRLFFCSCKALKHHLASQDTRTRERLMDALHEADNLSDHFASQGAIVVLAVTTDFFDEREKWVRYEPLHGKAVVLGVRILSAETLLWAELLKQIRNLVERE